MASARRYGVPLLLAVVSALLVTGAASPTYASPGTSGKPSVADIERQIDDANNALEPLIEDYNKVHSQLGTDQHQVDVLTKQLQPLQLDVNFALAKIQPLVTGLYENGKISTLDLLTGTGAGSLLDRLTISDQVAHIQHDKIANVLTALNKYLAAKKTLDASVVSLQLRKDDLASRTKIIQTKLDALQVLRRQVFGASASVGVLRPVVCPFTYIGGPAGIAVKTACSEIGKPYVWAAAGPNVFDCSGLTLYAWGKAGVTLRHFTGWQWADTKPVTRAQLQPGDLVFFYPGSLHHMGIYVGGGWMVHAPHTGDVVRMARIDTYPIAGYRRP